MYTQIPPFYSNNYITIWVMIGRSNTDLTVHLSNTPYTTKDFPLTIPLLDKLLPSVFEGKCFNHRQVCFREEAEDTEIPHLFEHILLEHLFLQNNSNTYRGKTLWNWEKEPKGRFHVYINHGIQKESYIVAALNESISVLELILTNSHRQPVDLRSQPITLSAELKD